jgi:hypothetical protein
MRKRLSPAPLLRPVGSDAVPARWPATCLPSALPRPDAGCAHLPLSETLAEAARGCGWFDSSLELQAGLRVRECALTEAALPLGWWLQWQLGQAGQPGQLAR